MEAFRGFTLFLLLLPTAAAVNFTASHYYGLSYACNFCTDCFNGSFSVSAGHGAATADISIPYFYADFSKENGTLEDYYGDAGLLVIYLRSPSNSSLNNYSVTSISVDGKAVYSDGKYAPSMPSLFYPEVIVERGSGRVQFEVSMKYLRENNGFSAAVEYEELDNGTVDVETYDRQTGRLMQLCLPQGMSEYLYFDRVRHEKTLVPDGAEKKLVQLGLLERIAGEGVEVSLLRDDISVSYGGKTESFSRGPFGTKRLGDRYTTFYFTSTRKLFSEADQAGGQLRNNATIGQAYVAGRNKAMRYRDGDLLLQAAGVPVDVIAAVKAEEPYYSRVDKKTNLEVVVYGDPSLRIRG